MSPGLRAARVTARGNVTLGDVIQAIDGKPVADFEGLINILDAHDFGDRVKLTLLRGDQHLDVSVMLSAAGEQRSIG